MQTESQELAERSALYVLSLGRHTDDKAMLLRERSF